MTQYLAYTTFWTEENQRRVARRWSAGQPENRERVFNGTDCHVVFEWKDNDLELQDMCVEHGIRVLDFYFVQEHLSRSDRNVYCDIFMCYLFETTRDAILFKLLLK